MFLQKIKCEINNVVRVIKGFNASSSRKILTRRYGKLVFGSYHDNPILVKMHNFKHPFSIRPKSSDYHVMLQIFFERDYDILEFPQGKKIFNRYQSLVDRGITPVIFDCGANIGLSTIWFKEAFPDALIYAIEPDQNNFNLLVRNTRDLSNVKTIKAGVWDQKTTLEIDQSIAGNWTFQVKESNHNIESGISSVTLNDLLKDLKHKEILIVKMDVEGAEEFIFRSNTAWIENTSLIIIELHDFMFPGREVSKNFMKEMKKRNVEIISRGENLFSFLK